MTVSQRSRWEQKHLWVHLYGKNECGNDISGQILEILNGRKTMTNLDSILKHITLPTKVHIVKAMVFPVVMYRCKCWTIKKAESQEWMLSNCDAGEDSWKSPGQQGDQTSQSWRKSTLNIHRKDSSWIWSYNTFGHVMQRADLLDKTLMLERLKAKVEESGRRWDG